LNWRVSVRSSVFTILVHQFVMVLLKTQLGASCLYSKMYKTKEFQKTQSKQLSEKQFQKRRKPGTFQKQFLNKQQMIWHEFQRESETQSPPLPRNCYRMIKPEHNTIFVPFDNTFGSVN
jgi:hypothetical protein